MVISKGEVWGEPGGSLPSATLSDDAALAASVCDQPGSVVAVSGGDLHRTLGLGEQMRSDPLWFPMDLGFASLDGDAELPFVAHVVARSRWRVGAGAVVMNAAWIGDRYLGPRAHPNDGLLDITFGSLPFRQLIAASRRSKTGTHLPHPALTVRRSAMWAHTFERPRQICLDGVRRGTATHLEVRLEPDWFTLVG